MTHEIEKEDGMKATMEEATLVRRVLAMSGSTAPMHDRLEARRIVDRFLPILPQSRGNNREDQSGD